MSKLRALCLCGCGIAAVVVAATVLPGMSSGMSPAAPAAAVSAAKTTYQAVAPIRFADLRQPYDLATFRLADDGNLLVCLTRKPELRILSPDGRELATWTLPFLPHALCAGAEGTVYVGGEGSQVVRLDKMGKVLNTLSLPAGKSGYQRVTCLALDGKDLYVGFRNEGGFTIYRYGQDLGGGQQVLKGQRGCCGQFDFAVRDGTIYVADNTRHRLAKYDKEGKLLGAWGERSRDAADTEGFSSCCNPMNVCVGPDGMVYASESGAGLVKRFSPDGKFLGVAASYATKLACKHVGVALSRDGGTIYVIDVGESLIRVFKAAAPQPEAAKTAAATSR